MAISSKGGQSSWSCELTKPSFLQVAEKTRVPRRCGSLMIALRSVRVKQMTKQTSKPTTAAFMCPSVHNSMPPHPSHSPLLPAPLLSQPPSALIPFSASPSSTDPPLFNFVFVPILTHFQSFKVEISLPQQDPLTENSSMEFMNDDLRNCWEPPRNYHKPPPPLQKHTHTHQNLQKQKVQILKA